MCERAPGPAAAVGPAWAQRTDRPLFPLTAVVAALGSSLAYAITAVTEQLSTKRVKRRGALSPELLLDLVKQPLWLVGIGANVASFALQVVALRFGPLALVEPILVCDLIFAGLTTAVLKKRADPVTGAGIVACAAGVAGFLIIARPSAGREDISLIEALPLLAGFAAVLAWGRLALARWNQTVRPLALALACGAAYAATDFAIKLATTEFSGGLVGVFTHWPIYAVAIIGPIGFLLNQSAFQAGALLAPVLAIITITDTIGADRRPGLALPRRETRQRPSADRGPGSVAARDDRRDRRPRPPVPAGRPAAGPGPQTRRSDGERAEFIRELIPRHPELPGRLPACLTRTTARDARVAHGREG